MPRPLSEIEALTRPGAGGRAEPSTLADMTEALRKSLADKPATNQQPDCLVRRAIRDSLGAPGKLVRGQLVLLTVSAWGCAWRPALEVARAGEIVHASSLVIDDLPAMDNAALRRGTATVHRVHGEATAILAAVAMLAQAFEAFAGAEVSAGGGVLAAEAR